MTNKEETFDDAIQNLNDISDELIQLIDNITNELKTSSEIFDWLWVGFHSDNRKWACSFCGNTVEHQVSICPKCGAKMKLWY